MTNTTKYVLALASALTAIAGQADVVPDGKIKHAMIVGGLIGTGLSTLFARLPADTSNTVSVPRP